MTEELTKQAVTLKLSKKWDLTEELEQEIKDGVYTEPGAEKDVWTLATAVFPNGAYADLNVCEEDSKCWLEMWFYDTDGEHFDEQVPEARNTLEGVYSFTDKIKNIEYEVTVVKED